MWESLIQQGLQLGAGYAQGAVQQSRSNAVNQRQLGGQFDSRAGEVTRLFDQIGALPVITANDLQIAVNAYAALAQIVEQYGGVAPNIATQWATSAYQPAFQARLQQLAARVSTGGAVPTSLGGAMPTSGTANETDGSPSAVAGLFDLSLSNPVVLLAAGVLLAKAVFK